MLFVQKRYKIIAFKRWKLRLKLRRSVVDFATEFNSVTTGSYKVSAD